MSGAKSPRITGGEWKGRRLVGGVGAGVRPTPARLREVIGSILALELPGAVVLDAFAGSGCLAAEACSRGASRAVAVEKRASTARDLRRSLEMLDPERFDVIRGDVLRLATAGDLRGHGPFDVVFADPPWAGPTPPARLAIELVSALLAASGSIAPSAALLLELPAREAVDLSALPAPLVRDRRYGDTRLLLLRSPTAPC